MGLLGFLMVPCVEVGSHGALAVGLCGDGAVSLFALPLLWLFTDFLCNFLSAKKNENQPLDDLDSIKVKLWCVPQAGPVWFLHGCVASWGGEDPKTPAGPAVGTQPRATGGLNVTESRNHYG